LIKDKSDRSYIATEESSQFLKVDGKWLYLDGVVSDPSEEVLSGMIERWVPPEVIAEDNAMANQ
jgi:uncharacterized protein YchJ